jgi:hypothetical protein
MIYPFGLNNTTTIYQGAIHRPFGNPDEQEGTSDLYVSDSNSLDHPTPMINMVSLHQLPDRVSDPTESLHKILGESPQDESSKGSTGTISSYPTFPLGFGGMIFAANADRGTKEGKTPQECEDRVAKNATRQ